MRKRPDNKSIDPGQQMAVSREGRVRMVSMASEKKKSPRRGAQGGGADGQQDDQSK